jgi:hypothetical protein
MFGAPDSTIGIQPVIIPAGAATTEEGLGVDDAARLGRAEGAEASGASGASLQAAVRASAVSASGRRGAKAMERSMVYVLGAGGVV